MWKEAGSIPCGAHGWAEGDGPLDRFDTYRGSAADGEWSNGRTQDFGS